MDADDLRHLTITRLQHTYADIATRMAWAEMAQIVLPDAHFTFDLQVGGAVELVGPAQLAAFGARACERFDFYSYQPLSAVLLSADDTSAVGRSYSLEVGLDRELGAWAEYYGHYHDAYAVSADGWRFAGRDYTVTARRVGGETTTFDTPAR